MPFDVNYPDLANNPNEAQARFRIAKAEDPFPEVPHALLNSADVYDYVRMTGMLYPFHIDSLKSGSYEAAINGRCIWWDENGDRQEKALEEGNPDGFVLKANSIAFVQVEPFFRLPDYIALRFNLKITHVHRGILLGTGPLVDPGFEGKLLIPLHNLTTNDYHFKCGEGLIWIEFTKTSPLPAIAHKILNPYGLTKNGSYIPFPDDKKNKEPEYYFSKASPYKSIRSSIPQAVKFATSAATSAEQSAASSAKRAEESRKRLERFTRFWSIAAGAAAVITIAAVLVATWALIQDTFNLASEIRKQLQQQTENEARDNGEAEATSQRLERRLNDELLTLKKHLNTITHEVGLLKTRTPSLNQRKSSQP